MARCLCITTSFYGPWQCLAVPRMQCAKSEKGKAYMTQQQQQNLIQQVGNDLDTKSGKIHFLTDYHVYCSFFFLVFQGYPHQRVKWD